MTLSIKIVKFCKNVQKVEGKFSWIHLPGGKVNGVKALKLVKCEAHTRGLIVELLSVLWNAEKLKT